MLRKAHANLVRVTNVTVLPASTGGRAHVQRAGDSSEYGPKTPLLAMVPA